MVPFLVGGGLDVELSCIVGDSYSCHVPFDLLQFLATISSLDEKAEQDANKDTCRNDNAYLSVLGKLLIFRHYTGVLHKERVSVAEALAGWGKSPEVGIGELKGVGGPRGCPMNA